jgi:AhpD family alkylhydroperoxidase
MEQQDIDEIEKIIHDREVGREKLKFYSPDVYKTFLDLNNNTFIDGSLTKMHKELIALGIAIRINCEPCIQNHIRKALEAGASEQQIIETIEVSIEMGGGPATVSSRFALKVLEYYQNKKKISSN